MLAKKDTNENASPFHKGEQAIQERLGLRERMESFGRRMIRSHMPDQHRDFYADLPFIVVGSVNEEGWPWASVLPGMPGFISSPDARTLAVNAKALPGDPLGKAIAPDTQLGLLGIELASRRRNRVNVRVTSTHGTGFEARVDEAFGNCPQYIQTRSPKFVRDAHIRSDTASIETIPALDTAAAEMIRASDTFFVSSYVTSEETGAFDGVDVSHRGGRAGFVKVDGNVLTIPDYAGNNHFNTLGNLLLNPRAGLTFVDFETGDLLMLTGTVELLWDDHQDVKAFRGAERAWRFTLDHGIRLKDALPMRWSFGEFAPTSLITGDWEEAEATQAAEAKREQWRGYRVTRVVDESEVIRSFYLEPADGDGLSTFHAGQFLTIRVHPENADGAVMRTYTLSSAPSDPHYRISVKREPAPDDNTPAGLVSNHLHDTLKVGDLINAKAPRGGFTFDEREERPAVLLAGGVGVTPMIAMARQALHEGRRARHIRPLTIFHSSQNTGQRAFFQDFLDLQTASGGVIRYVSLVDNAAPGEKPGRDFHGTGYITADMLRQVLPLDDYDFYLCGPAPFMQAVYDSLRTLGVRDGRIFAEAFGPASLQRKADEGTAKESPSAEPAEEAIVHFDGSGFSQAWSKGEGTLLELAEAHGLAPEYGCRSGSCGACAVKLTAGEVAYPVAPSAPHGEDEALICCAMPASETVELAL